LIGSDQVTILPESNQLSIRFAHQAAQGLLIRPDVVLLAGRA